MPKAAPVSPPIESDIQVECWPIERLIPRANNPRTHSREQVANIAASIREWGWTNPILIGADDDIIAGHARLLAARKLGMEEVPVIVLRHLSPAQRRALVIADNQLAIAGAGWDEERLRTELATLHEEDFNLDLVGLDDAELARLLEAQDAVPGLTDEDAVPDVQPEPVTRLGDLYILGNHRLICGDCTQPEVVARLLGDARPQVLITDPPYGIELDSEWRDRAGLNGYGPAETSYMKHRTKGHTETTISGDTRADWSEAFALQSDLQVGYVWHASKFMLAGLLSWTTFAGRSTSIPRPRPRVSTVESERPSGPCGLSFLTLLLCLRPAFSTGTGGNHGWAMDGYAPHSLSCG